MISFKCSDKCTRNNSEDEYDSITKGQSVIYFQQEMQTIEDKVSEIKRYKTAAKQKLTNHSRIAKKVHKVNIHSKECKRKQKKLFSTRTSTKKMLKLLNFQIKNTEIRLMIRFK